MDVLTVLSIVLAVAVVGLASFAGIQRRRRSGGVIAAKPRRRRGGR